MAMRTKISTPVAQCVHGFECSWLIFLTLPAWFSWNPLLPYFASVLLLILGLSIAIKRSPQSHYGDKLILIGPVFVGMPMALFGIDHYLNPSGIGRIIPSWIPLHSFWVYLVGTCLILGGVSILVQIYAELSAALFGVMLLCFEVLMNIPAVVGFSHNRLIWALALRELSFSCGALSFAMTGTELWRRNGAHWLISVCRSILGLILIVFGVWYSLHPELLPGVPLRQLTPDFIPGRLLWGYLTSLVYVIGGLFLLINKSARAVATWIGLYILFSVIMFCIPYMFQYGSDVQKGLNVPLDTLMFCGSVLCLAGSQPKGSARLVGTA